MKKGLFSTPIKNWLNAMQKAKRIQPGGKLMFINKQTGAPTTQQPTLQPTLPQTLPTDLPGNDPERS